MLLTIMITSLYFCKHICPLNAKRSQATLSPSASTRIESSAGTAPSVLMEQLRRPVSLSDQHSGHRRPVEMVERETLRYELRKARGDTRKIRQNGRPNILCLRQSGTFLRSISKSSRGAKAGASTLRPAAPSRESYLGLLEAFEGVLRFRERYQSNTSWYYIRQSGWPFL